MERRMNRNFTFCCTPDCNLIFFLVELVFQNYNVGLFEEQQSLATSSILSLAQRPYSVPATNKPLYRRRSLILLEFLYCIWRGKPLQSAGYTRIYLLRVRRRLGIPSFFFAAAAFLLFPPPFVHRQFSKLQLRKLSISCSSLLRCCLLQFRLSELLPLFSRFFSTLERGSEKSFMPNAMCWVTKYSKWDVAPLSFPCQRKNGVSETMVASYSTTGMWEDAKGFSDYSGTKKVGKPCMHSIKQWGDLFSPARKRGCVGKCFWSKEEAFVFED